MTNINLDLAVKLDGSETHMIAILVDSWGDKLVVPLHCEMVIEPADFFIPCAHCGNAVLECNFEAGMDTCDRCNAGPKHVWMPTKIKLNSDIAELNPEDRPTYIKSGIGNGLSQQDMDKLLLIHTLPEDLMKVKEELVRQEVELAEVKNLLEVKMEITGKTMEDRIKAAVQEASDAFWEVIAKKHFPDAVDGAFLMSDMDDIMLSWVQHWVDNNVPKPEHKIQQSHSGHEVADLHLHYQDTWHLCHTGGGCMVAVTDNVAIAGEYRYLAVSGECVAVYVDDFTGENFLQDALFDWAFGDNPTVLMNYLNDYLGNECLFDMNKLFDDIITLGKSDKVS